jgi:hypothetical protein
MSCSGYSAGQAVVRQSINAYGGSSEVNNVLIEQSAGQPHQTETIEDAEVKVRPGFIQSRTFNVEIEKESNTLEGTVYPNPARESFKLELDESVEDANILISDATGVVVERIVIKDFREHLFDSSNWKAGTYFISLVSSEGKIFKSKLIITQ